MKSLKIFINPKAESAIETIEAKHAIRTLANIAGLPTQFFSNSKEGPFDLAYSNNPSKVPCRVFIPISANKKNYYLNPAKLIEGRVENDIVLTTYILISGLHELGTKRDAHNHHHIETSVLYQKKILHIPLINQYASLLRKTFASYNPLPIWPKGKTWAAAITHDVDYPQMIRWIEILRYLVTHKGPRKLSVITDIVAGKNNFWKFQDWINLEIKNEVRSAFYFCGRKGSLLEYLIGIPDPFYDVCSEKFRTVINQLKENGFEVGLHASYNSFKSLAALKTEINEDDFFVCYGNISKRDNFQLMLNQVQKVSLDVMKTSALQSESFDHVKEDFVIEIPSNVSKPNLSKLKQILNDNPGETPVKLIVNADSPKPKTISLKSGLTLSPSIKSQIMTLLK